MIKDMEEIVKVLNGIHELDSGVMQQLIDYRVTCNKALAEHPAVQVVESDEGFEVGILGIINGLFGAKKDGTGHIGVVLDGAGKLARFTVFQSD